MVHINSCNTRSWLVINGYNPIDGSLKPIQEGILNGFSPCAMTYCTVLLHAIFRTSNKHNYPERIWISQEWPCEIKGYCEKQRSFYPPIIYIPCETYSKSILAPNSYSYNKYENEPTDNRGYIPSGIPTIPTNYVPKFTKYSAHEH